MSLNFPQWAVVLLLLFAPCLGARSIPNSTPPLSLTKPKSQFFAGVITRLSPGLVVVSRSIPGRAPEHRTFLITPKTKMARTLRLRLRVTVRFQRMIEGDIALEIQVRPKPVRPSTTAMSYPLPYGAVLPIPACRFGETAQLPVRPVLRSL